MFRSFPLPVRLGRPMRLLLAATCFLLAAALALGAPPADASGTVPVVLARHDLAAGQVLRVGDLVLTRWPRAFAPPTALRARADAVGRRLAAPVVAGEPLIPKRLVGRELASGLGPDTVAMSVSVADVRVGDFVHAGDRVDLYAVTADSLEPAVAEARPNGAAAAQAVLVLAVLPPPNAGSGPTDAGLDGASAELVIALSRTDVARIAGGKTAQKFAVVLDPP